jgi:hypothetical protein
MEFKFQIFLASFSFSARRAGQPEECQAVPACARDGHRNRAEPFGNFTGGNDRSYWNSMGVGKRTDNLRVWRVY